MTYSQAYLRAITLANYRQINYAIVQAKPGELQNGFYCEDASTAPPEQVVAVIAPDGAETTPNG
jgi:hypothetical protein